jgi:hypothetical protein
LIIGINKQKKEGDKLCLKSYNSKVVVSGDFIEIYEYDRSVLEGYSIKEYHNCGRCFDANKEDKALNRSKTLTRARRELKRVINSNIYMYDVESKFVTLTFAEHVTTFEVANYEFKKFRQRLEYELHFKLKYAVVPEFTKIGRIHFHLVMFNVPFIRNSKLRNIWSNGFVKINKIENVDNVGAYVCKYMTKDNVDERLKGKKCYFTSRGLYKPIEIKEKDRVDNLLCSLPAYALTYANTFENDYNKTIYKQYNMSKAKIEEVK